ncbi:MAG: type VI secretion system baseplate subunit TssG [Telluria sp.]
MPTENGRDHARLIERLLAEPQRFGFFQAVRLAVQWLGEQGIAPGPALARHLRFRNSVSFAFPPSEIEQLQLTEPAGGLPQQFWITPAFIGMLGAHGALPAHVSEHLVAWESAQHDEGARAFLDLLTNRMVALFYEAWCKYRVEEAVAAERDRYKPLLLALAGCPGRDGLAGIPDDAMALYAGLLQQRPVSSIVLGQVLSGYLGVAVAVEETVDFWDDMAPEEQTSLGSTNATLGDDAVAGARSWRPDLRLRLSVGPLDRARYEDFLPGRPAAEALAALLRLVAEPTLVYEIVLMLRRDAVHAASLDGETARLGLDSFLGAGSAGHDRTDMRYDLHPLRHLTLPR